MRYIHQVGLQERFVASGIYAHLLDGRPTRSIEEWSIHIFPDAALRIRMDDDGRAADGSSVLAEAWIAPPAEGGLIERVDLEAYGRSSDPIKRLRATYLMDGDTLEVGLQADQQERQQLAVTLPPERFFSPKGLIFAGMEALYLARHPGQEFTIISYFPTLTSDIAYRPVAYRQVIEPHGTETLQIGRQSYVATVYQQHSPDRGQGLTLWLDSYGVLLQFKSDDQRYGALLTEYARRPDPHE